MRSAILGVIGGLALAAAGPPAAAQTAGDRADARCLLVLRVVGQNPANKEAAAQGIFYYLGRLQAHGLSGKLDPLFLAEVKTLQGQQQLQGEATRCNNELTAHSADLANAFKKLQAQLPPPPPRPAAPPAKGPPAKAPPAK